MTSRLLPCAQTHSFYLLELETVECSFTNYTTWWWARYREVCCLGVEPATSRDQSDAVAYTRDCHYHTVMLSTTYFTWSSSGVGRSGSMYRI